MLRIVHPHLADILNPKSFAAVFDCIVKSGGLSFTIIIATSLHMLVEKLFPNDDSSQGGYDHNMSFELNIIWNTATHLVNFVTKFRNEIESAG